MIKNTLAAVVHLNFRSQFVLYLALWTGLSGATTVDVVRLYASYRLNLILLKWLRCIIRAIYFSLAFTHYKIISNKYLTLEKLKSIK